MQNMLLCIINVVNPKVYNPENHYFLFQSSAAHLLCILKEATVAGLVSESGALNGQVILGSGCCLDSAHFPNWKRPLGISFDHQSVPMLLFCLCL